MATSDQASIIKSRWQSIVDEQDRAADTILRNSWALDIEAYLKTILNGFIVIAHPSKLKYIENMAEVRAVYPNCPVQLALQHSVPSIGAPEVWNMADACGNPVTGRGVTVGIIDSGIDYKNPDLGGCYGSGCKVAGGWDFVNNDADPIDDYGHGTLVAGIVAADGILKGVAKDATLFAFKVVDKNGNGEIADVIEALEEAADPDRNSLTDDHLDVINLSLGYREGGVIGELSQEVNRHVVDAGMAIVIAAGNRGPDYNSVSDPGYSEEAITVGASDNEGYAHSFSSRGYYNHIKPDVLAPGYDIISTYLFNVSMSISGTSMAAPHVAGAAALLKQLHPELTPNQIKARLMNTSITRGYDPFIEGAGQIRVDRAATVEMMFWPGSLMLGYLKHTQDDWSSAGEFELTNTSTYTRNYQLAVGPLMGASDRLGNPFVVDPEKYNVNLSQTFVTLDSGASTRLSISATVQPEGIFAPAQRPQAYFSSITADDGVQEIRLPFVILYSPSGEINGWPVWADGGQSSLIVDLDSDGDTEVVRQTKKAIVVYNSDGSLLAGWPKSLSEGSTDAAPVAGDIDGDGDLEIVVCSGLNSVTAFHHNGSIVKGWPVQTEPEVHFPILADLDADGVPEVVVGAAKRARYSWDSSVNSLYAFDGNGSRFSGWPVWVPAEAIVKSVPLAVDMDGDRRMEIVWSSAGSLFAFHHDGSLVNGWPVLSSSPVIPGSGCCPVAGDIDNDGDIEIILNSPGQIYAWHHDGSVVEGWPVDEAGTFSYDPPILGDLDGDGDLEIVMTISHDNNPAPSVVDYRYGIHAVHHDGTPVSGFPIFVPDTDGTSDPLIGDIDGDRDQEILFVATIESSDLTQLCAYHLNGQPVRGFPINGYFAGTPTLGDVDHDGDTDVLMGGIEHNSWDFRTGMLHAFDLTGSLVLPNIEWGSWRHDPWGTGNYHHGTSRRARAIWDRLQRLRAKQSMRDVRQPR